MRGQNSSLSVSLIRSVSVGSEQNSPPACECGSPFWVLLPVFVCACVAYHNTPPRTPLRCATKILWFSLQQSLLQPVPIYPPRSHVLQHNNHYIIIIIAHSHRWRSNEQQPRNKVIEPSYHRIGRANRILFSESSPTIGNGREDPPANLFR